MDEYEQQERQRALEEKVRYLDEMQQAANAKMYRDTMRRQEQVTSKMFNKALTKYGLTQQEFTRLAAANPEETMESLYDHIKGHAKRLASLKGKAKEPRMRPANSRPPRQESRSRSGEFEELKAKAQAGKITEDELLGYLNKL